ncbi:MAG: hypothetical protein KatS3mg110_0918 [Pirellulaceae bacterium]|nr:MAG: hypothetical protein KatS3mg110_0918 [Pirellulaceae bacterium]
MKRLWQMFLHAARNLRQGGWRTALTTLGVAIAQAALVTMLAVAIGLQEEIERPLRQLGLLTTIEVRPGDVGPAREPGPSPQQLAVLDDAAVKRFESLPGVKAAYPDLRMSQVKLHASGKTATCTAVGVPRETAWLGPLADSMLAGSFFSIHPETPEVVITPSVAAQLGFDPPETAVARDVRLTAEGLTEVGEQTFSLASQTLDLRIVGVFRPPGLVGPWAGNLALVPLDLMRQLPGAALETGLRRLRSSRALSVSGYSQVIVRVERLSDVEPVERAIGAMGYRTRSMLDRLEETRSLFIVIDLVLAAIGTVALVVAGLGILNTFLMSVMERYREIGLYKAMGASDRDIYVMFLFEAVLLGLAGGCAGTVLAAGTCWLMQLGLDWYLHARSAPAPLGIFRFPWWLPLFGLGYAALVSILGGWYPAHRAARLDPIRALRHE